MITILRTAIIATVTVIFAIVPVMVNATAVTTDLFFTTFAGGTNVWKTTSSYDGATTHTLASPTAIGSTAGADGIAGNPQNADLLLIGGQAGRINTISKTTGTATTYASPVNVFHLEVTDDNTVFGSGIPSGSLARHDINPDGSLSVGTNIPVSGDIGTITQLIETPSGFYFTSSGPGGNGAFGTLMFDTGNPDTATTATTSILSSPEDAAHGGVYDPFTNSVIIGGDNEISQYSLDTDTFSSNYIQPTGPCGSVTFDQGTVDGMGHLYWASNQGCLLFVDYSASGLVSDASNFTDFQFLISNLDDVAPLVGSGSTDPDPTPMLEPSTITLLLIGLVGLVLRQRYSNGNA